MASRASSARIGGKTAGVFASAGLPLVCRWSADGLPLLFLVDLAIALFLKVELLQIHVNGRLNQLGDLHLLIDRDLPQVLRRLPGQSNVQLVNLNVGVVPQAPCPLRKPAIR